VRCDGRESFLAGGETKTSKDLAAAKYQHDERSADEIKKGEEGEAEIWLEIFMRKNLDDDYFPSTSRWIGRLR